MSFSSFFVSAGRSAAAMLGGEPDVMQQALLVVEAEQQRADDLGLRAVTKAAHDAIRAAEVFDLLHPVALARSGSRGRAAWR